MRLVGAVAPFSVFGKRASALTIRFSMQLVTVVRVIVGVDVDVVGALRAASRIRSLPFPIRIQSHVLG